MKRVRLIALRKQLKLSQTEVAQHIGISIAAYGRIETGKNLLTAEIMLKLCGYFQCDLEAIVDDWPGNHPQKPAYSNNKGSATVVKEQSMEQLYRQVVKMQEVNVRDTAFLMQNLLERCENLLRDMNENIPFKQSYL